MSRSGEDTRRAARLIPHPVEVEAPVLANRRASGALLRPASARLLGVSDRDRASVDRFLATAEREGVSLEHLWAAVEPDSGVVRHACLLSPGAGGTGMLFTSALSETGDRAEIAALVDEACAGTPGLRLAQALLEREEAATRDLLLGAGFTHVGDLAYMRRPWRSVKRRSGDGAWPEGIEVRRWRRGDERALGEALERTYEDTLDCPELRGIRDPLDVIESHRSVGRWDPSLWWLVLHEGAPSGALLLNPYPDEEHTELVYLGLSPEIRGRGLGGRLLRHGLRALEGRRERSVTCAVDERNAPAIALYARHGFRRFARRVALVRAQG